MLFGMHICLRPEWMKVAMVTTLNLLGGQEQVQTVLSSDATNHPFHKTSCRYERRGERSVGGRWQLERGVWRRCQLCSHKSQHSLGFPATSLNTVSIMSALKSQHSQHTNPCHLHQHPVCRQRKPVNGTQHPDYQVSFARGSCFRK